VEGVACVTWQDRSVLVTGASGFIGSWLTRRLVHEGARVVAAFDLVDPQSEFARAGVASQVEVVEGLLQDPRTADAAFASGPIDTVFHLGAQTIVGAARVDPVATFEANVRGSYLLLDACRAAGASVERVVVASSDKAYGATAALPYQEDAPLAGREPYEVSKSCTDLLAQAYATAYGLPVAVARCGNVYGGGDLNWSRIVPGTVRALLEGVTPVIRSDGTFVRDYLHVDDVVDAYLALADGIDRGVAAAQAFNFSDESPRSVLELYTAICEAAGVRVEPDIRSDAPGEIHNQYLDAAKARELLGWKARVDLGDGLARTVSWYRELLG
jgi:CDP-glucose 4,6-dehydratase